METEVYQLIDTALKIGLGAFITGASGYLLMVSKHNHENKIALRTEHVSTLRELAIKIEQARNLFDHATHPYWLKVAERDISNVTEATKLALDRKKEALAVLREVRAICALLSINENVKLLDEADELVDLAYQKLAQSNPFECADEVNAIMAEVDQKLVKCLEKLATEYANA
ncbi:hypothetical protein CGJ90_22210 [Vibrio parahaemolyticus]|uniref:hypothetical protein n=1 Tax=Vibrio parahaemolyticus TaxID=670 RepID=UPI00112157A9|nr:hypothetical protein [Vibrio parahaemolyticus]MBE4323069.1 hypothetical protein [Vibrio parahaemolyticus]MBE4341249.1 hypothetical protein [Vibrio parahaemolyticus]MCS0016591.1 hypothetical protein [Vibrio parahaemolyticus]QLE30707.1 hypothetical protein FDV78_09200 [Vibrio parahaemolyticus]TOB15041.1 hypothetical protein CGK10_23725 [Vibrio parahaemolyticus]